MALAALVIVVATERDLVLRDRDVDPILVQYRRAGRERQRVQADRLDPDLLAGRRVDHVNVRAEIAEHQHLALRARQLAVADARAQRRFVHVDPAHAWRTADVDREQPRGIRHRQEQRAADDRRLRAHRRRLRECECPRELEVAHVLGAQAGLRCAQAAMVRLVEAEAGHRRRGGQVQLAAVCRAHRLRDPVVAGRLAADEEVDHVRAFLRAERRALRLHLALRERVADRLVAHRLERVERRRARGLGVVVARGARALVDRLAGMTCCVVRALHAHRRLRRGHRLRIADCRRLGRLRLRAPPEQQGRARYGSHYDRYSGDHFVPPPRFCALLTGKRRAADKQEL